jgi:exosome complex component CSL4
MADICVPGAWLGAETQYTGGDGTYTLNKQIFASVVGVKMVSEEEDKTTVSVRQDKPPQRLPEIGDLVTCRCAKVNTRYAQVDILVVGQEEDASSLGSLLAEPLGGMIRQRDVRAFEVDSVVLYESFRPGDIISARVVSLGDKRSYYLATAEEALGVVLAQSSASGATLVPISWQEMQCPLTQAKEKRKVAKVAVAEPDADADEKMETD